VDRPTSGLVRLDASELKNAFAHVAGKTGQRRPLRTALPIP
jgi:hypothetical protein